MKNMDEIAGSTISPFLLSGKRSIQAACFVSSAVQCLHRPALLMLRHTYHSIYRICAVYAQVVQKAVEKQGHMIPIDQRNCSRRIDVVARRDNACCPSLPGCNSFV